MVSVTSHNLDFKIIVLDLMASGCSTSASIDRCFVRKYEKPGSRKSSRGCGARKLVYCRQSLGQCRVYSTKTPDTPVNENPVLMLVAEQIFIAAGNRMRPALVFLVSRATEELVGLKELTTEHRRLAEIIEMIHTASLIHDDVLVESDMRRGKETVHHMYGTRVAVLAGDFMFGQSSCYLANLENLEIIKLISQVIKDFASGEIKQASSLFDCDIELEEYLIKSYYKTASLIAACTKGADIFSGVDSSVSKQMYDYGRNLALSFQIVDDILDFTQSTEQLGKPVGSDLAKGNLTAPVIFSLEKEPN